MTKKANNKNNKNKNQAPQMNPALANIFKIGSLLLVVALAALITVIIIETIKNKNDDNTDVFEEYTQLSISDLKNLTMYENATYTGWQDIANDDVREIVLGLENKDSKNIYVLFYNSNADFENLVASVEKLGDLEGKAFFFVNLDYNPGLLENSELAHLQSKYPDLLGNYNSFLLTMDIYLPIESDSFIKEGTRLFEAIESFK